LARLPIPPHRLSDARQYKFSQAEVNWICPVPGRRWRIFRQAAQAPRHFDPESPCGMIRMRCNEPCHESAQMKSFRTVFIAFCVLAATGLAIGLIAERHACDRLERGNKALLGWSGAIQSLTAENRQLSNLLAQSRENTASASAEAVAGRLSH